MKTLIVEDDFVSRKLVQKTLESFGDVDLATNGDEALTAFKEALDEKTPYDLICLDIMLPGKDGHEVLKQVRAIESEKGIHGLDGVKVIMTTALGDQKNLFGSFREGCEAYLVKPIMKETLIKEINALGLPVI